MGILQQIQRGTADLKPPISQPKKKSKLGSKMASNVETRRNLNGGSKCERGNRLTLLACLVLACLVKARTSDCEAFIKVTKFSVPTRIRFGEQARLSCHYELRNETLHAMKLFKDDNEFYRFTPNARNFDERKLAFPVPGIQVDLHQSSERDVLILNASELTAGLFKCQVSVEGTFKSVSAERRLEVMEKVSRTTQLSGSASQRQRQIYGPQQRHTVQQARSSAKHPQYVATSDHQQASTSGSAAASSSSTATSSASGGKTRASGSGISQLAIILALVLIKLA